MMDEQQKKATRTNVHWCFWLPLIFDLPLAEQRNVVNWLRTKAGIKRRQGVLNGRRYDYFKGAANR